MRKGCSSWYYLGWKRESSAGSYPHVQIPDGKEWRRRNQILLPERMQGNGHKSKLIKFHLSAKPPHFWTVSMLKWWKTLCRTFVELYFYCKNITVFSVLSLSQIQNKALHELLWRITLSQPNPAHISMIMWLS